MNDFLTHLDFENLGSDFQLRDLSLIPVNGPNQTFQCGFWFGNVTPNCGIIFESLMGSTSGQTMLGFLTIFGGRKTCIQVRAAGPNISSIRMINNKKLSAGV